MSSEKQNLSGSHKDLISASSAESQDRSEQLHITTTGKGGKLLRKKLAIALGLRTNSSASTTSQSEGEDVQNVVEVFRKQVRKTVDFRTSKNLPKQIQEKEEQNSDKGSFVIRNTVRKTTDMSGEFIEEDQYDEFDDIEETETVSQTGSKDHRSVTAKKSETFSRERSRDSSSERRRTTTKPTKDVNKNEFVNLYKNTDETERVFRKTRLNEVQDNKTSASKKEKVGKEGNISKIEFWDLKAKHEKHNGSDILTSTSEAEKYDSNIGSNFKENVVQSEEVFSSYGEQSETIPNSRQFGEVLEPQSSSKESVKLLRDKIRKNARARQVPRGSRVDREKIEENRMKENIIRTLINESGRERHGGSDPFPFDLPSSNIPIYVSKRKVSDTQARPGGHSYLRDIAVTADYSRESINESLSDSQKKSVQVSKIPRRKSQNAKDEMGTGVVRLKVNEIERQSVSAQNFSTIQPIDDDKGLSGNAFRQKGETERREISLQQKPLQKTNSKLSKLLRKASKTSEDSLISTAISKRKTYLHINTTTTKSETSNSLTNRSERKKSPLDTTISTSRNKTSSVSQFDFDSFEVELSKLKASVFKTYEEFKDIRSLTVSVREDLNDLRNIYGSLV